MPVYLAHGFRWPREGFTGIRVHAIVNNLENCSVEYIQNDNSREELLRSFRKAHPDLMKELESAGGGGGAGRRRIDFLEQYDPEDETGEHAVSQPYAFVCNRVLMIAGGKDAAALAGKLEQAGGGSIASGSGGNNASGVGVGVGGGRNSPTTKRTRAPTQPMSLAAPFNSPATCTALSVSVEEVIADGPGMSTQAWEAMADLRDKLAEGEKIGWWVVYNGDPERAYDDDDDDEDDDEEEEEEGEDVEDEEGEKAAATLPIANQTTTTTQSPTLRQQTSPRSPPRQTENDTQGVRSPTGGRVPPPVAPPTVPPKSAGSPTSPPPSPVISTLPVRDKGLRAPGMTTASVVPESAKEDILEPPKLKEVAKSQGLRKKFFGKRA